MNVLNQSIIKHKMGLLNLAEELHNVSQACRVMGVSRDTFYRVKEAKESGGMEALLHKDRRRANLKNRVDEAVEKAIMAFAVCVIHVAASVLESSICHSSARSGDESLLVTNPPKGRGSVNSSLSGSGVRLRPSYCP